MKKSKKISIILLGAISITGCSYQHIIHIHIISATELNHDNHGLSKPVLVRVYKLASPLPFKHLPYAKLLKQPEQSLGSSLLDYNNYEIKPNHHQGEQITIDPTVKYIGLTIGYHQLTNNWKCLTYIPHTHQHIALTYVINIDQVSCEIKEHYL